MRKLFFTALGVCVLGLTACGADGAASSAGEMTPEKLTTLIQKFDEDATATGNSVTFSLNERELYLVYDKEADRMRIITPIAQSGIASEEILVRMLQANYDAVLDARYALANDIIWAVFIHPLGSLTQDDVLSGIAQTVTAAETFGSTYTSGAMVFGGGDSNSIHEDLLKELEKATSSGKEI
ncbi:hypothetical protein N9W89_00710 [Hellea sp.]|nr:hypothetical protein [Hellea sp.]